MADSDAVQLLEPKTREQICDAIKAYYFFTGFQPTVMYVTLAMERAWRKGLDGYIERGSRMFGLRLVYDAIGFKLAGRGTL